MLRANLSPKAKRDLRNIGTYTERKWGQNQRIKYTDQLYDRIDDLVLNPDKGRKRPDLPGNPYSYHEGRHVIFYRQPPEAIEIIRVLHDSMDFKRHR
jgi:toxin ParE1/3/4